MCGIAGYFGLSSENGQIALDKMTAALRLRGPDDAGIFIEGPVGIAHTRLSIIDLEGGRQPLFNEIHTICATVNGEIYNYRDLRKLLIDKGHRFSTKTDSETIIHLYEEYGTSFLDKLDGMYAIAVYDTVNKRLVLARDRLGKKPIHFTFINGVFYFASEIKALLALPAMQRRMNLTALSHYLALQYVPDTHCIFDGISKIQPAEYLVLENNHIIEKKHYWELVPKEQCGQENEVREKIRTLVGKAIRKRTIADVPLGVFLSGGMDSSIVTALLSSFSTTPVNTYSIGFLEEKYSELPKARSIAGKYGTKHREFILSLKELKHNLVPILAYLDEPLADPSVLPMHYLCRMAKNEITVALSGDGGDEIFAGYQRYKLDEQLRMAEKLPSFLINIISKAAGFLKVDFDVPIGKNRILGLKRLKQALSTPASASILRMGSYFNAIDISYLIKPELLNNTFSESSINWLSSFYNKPEQCVGHLNRTLYADLMTYAPGDYLVKADRMGMRNALEIRCPLLDIELTEYMFNLSSSLKIKPELKALLKDAFKDILTPEVLSAGKQGFTLPVGLWMNDAWLDIYKEYASDSRSITRTCFDDAYIAGLILEHQNHCNDHGKKLYSLLCLEIWAQHHLNT